jgi:hypothetical protein
MTEIIVDRLETHDRLKEFSKQKDNITQGCLDCINNRPKEFANHPFYIFVHCRTADDGYTKRLIWQPRLKKPKAQTNSMLFKSYPPGDTIKIIWMIPDRDQWDEYIRGKMFEQQHVADSILAFQLNRKSLEEDEIDDVSESHAQRIYREIAINHKMKLEKQKSDELARIKDMEIQ